MKNFGFKTQLVYFGGILLVSLVFFSMQFAARNSETGTGSMILLILWGLMVLFGIGGIIYSFAKKGRHSK